jgi:hypothetical protein
MKTRRIAETERTIDVIPPLTIFVDESGSVDFGVPKEGACKKALAVVAIAVPTMHFEAFRIMLPRNAEGRFLKAQDKEFHAGTALLFVNKLIASTAEVGAFLADPGAHENVELARERAERANRGRANAREKEETDQGKRQHPDIVPHDLHYLDFLAKAVVKCIEACAVRNNRPSFVDIVIDTMDINEVHRAWFKKEFTRVADKLELTIRRIDWKTEQEEPLLLLPDLFGGILCREDRYRDVGEAAMRLWDAERDGRFKFLNKPPPERPAEGEGKRDGVVA